MNGKRVFVTGGAGVIGLELIPKLIALGASVMVGDIKKRPKNFPTAVQYWHGDLNRLKVDELEIFDPEIIFHLAATFERSTESLEFWGENFKHNITLSHHVMSLASKMPNLQRVIFASSYLIYDPTLYLRNFATNLVTRLSESDPIRPRNLTGMAKLSHEMELNFLSNFSDIKFSMACVRIFRGYGRNSRDVISRWVRSLLAGETIKVFRPEGVFDYIYAKDSAEGLLRIASAVDLPKLINLGTGKSRRVADILSILQKHFPHYEAEEVETDILFETSEADTSLLKSVVGWEPEYTLEYGMSEIIEFEKANFLKAAKLKTSFNVLVSSSSAKISLLEAMKIAARKISETSRVVAGDSSANAISQYVADDYWRMPTTSDLEFDNILAGCKDRNINVVLPTRDGELEFWAKSRTRFKEHGISVVISELESILRCLDKFAFSKFGEDNDIPVIPSYLLPEDVQAEKLVVKERFGAGSRSIGLGLSLVEARKHASGLVQPIFQPLEVGQEISVDAWLDQLGEPRGVVLRHRVKVVNGESQITTTFHDAKIETHVKSILRKLHLRGPVVLQAMVNNGAIKIIECNARFGGASTTSLSVGLDMLYWSLLEEDGEVSIPEFVRYKGNVTQVRVQSDMILHDRHF